MRQKFTFGTVSYGTMRAEDLIDAFSSELHYLAKANKRIKEFRALLKECESYAPDDDDETPQSGAWDVFLHDKLIDTVWHANATVDEVRRSLINHDGYDSNIVVRKGK